MRKMRVQLAFLTLACGVHGMAAEPGSAWAHAAHTHDIDPLILYAMALQESRTMWTDGTARPWPWTLRSARAGTQRFASRESAADALQALLDAGERNIDIGMLQINWRYNGHRVGAADALLDPHRNLLVAAEILREALRTHGGDLRRAIGAYHHDPDTARGQRYGAEVWRRIEALRAVSGLEQWLAGAPGGSPAR